MTSVVHVICPTVEDVAGTERHVIGLSRELSQRGWEVAVICPPNRVLVEELDRVGVEAVVVPMRSHFDGRAVMAMAGAMRQRRADLVHTHLGRSTILGLAASVLARVPARVVTQHFIVPRYAERRDGPRRAISRLVYRALYSQVDRVVAVSEAARVAAIARESLAPRKVTTVHNGIDLAEFALPADPVEAGIREELGLAVDAPVVGVVSRLAPEKGHRLLFQAVAGLADEFPGLRLLVIGDGELTDDLRRAAHGLGLGERVIFLGFRRDVPRLLAALDLFVLPAHQEPFGIAVLEAMAAGRPVVATGVGGPLEIVEDGVSGLLVPPGNPVVLADAMRRVLTDTGLARRLAHAGRQRVEEHFTIAAMADKTLAIYREVLAGKGRGLGRLSLPAGPTHLIG